MLPTRRQDVPAHAQATSRMTGKTLLTLAASQEEDLSVTGDREIQGDTSLPLPIFLDLLSFQQCECFPWMDRWEGGRQGERKGGRKEGGRTFKFLKIDIKDSRVSC